MKFNKVSSKTTLTITTTVEELQKSLQAYQRDMLHDLLLSVNPKDKVETSYLMSVCMFRGAEFDNLIEKHAICWVNSPDENTSILNPTARWAAAVLDNPYLFGINDEEISEDVEEIILVIDGRSFNGNAIKDII